MGNVSLIANNLRIVVSFFDDNERPIICLSDSLSANDLLEVDVRDFMKKELFGVVKIVSFDERSRIPKAGIVGHQRHVYPTTFLFFFKETATTETILHSIPSEILKDDIKIIMQKCR